MAEIRLRLQDDLLESFDRWALQRGGRGAALPSLMQTAVRVGGVLSEPVSPEVKARDRLELKLGRDELHLLRVASAEMDFTANMWVTALVSRRLADQVFWPRGCELLLIGVQRELRAIVVRLDEMGRALRDDARPQASDQAGLSELLSLRREIRTHIRSLREAIKNGARYWDLDG